MMDIAKIAGVSAATVSRTISGSSLVREDTAARIRKIIQELGYVPNGSARSLGSGRSKLLGVVVSDIKNPFFPALISNFERLALDHSYDVILANTNYDPVRLEHCFQRMMERRVEGIAVMTSEMHPAASALLSRADTPVVALENGLSTEGRKMVRVDHGAGLQEAIEHLMELGHRDIAFIAGPTMFWSARTRKDYFLSEVRKRGLKISDDWVLEGTHQVEGGFAAMNQLMSLTKRPTAVMNSNDLTAIGAMKAIREAGLSVPGDYSVIGFDDIEMAGLVNPPLTSVQLSGAAIAQRAFQLLMDPTTESKRKRQESIKTKLIVRESTGIPRSR